MLPHSRTDPGDIVVDPFAGRCVTGEVCERLNRSWSCVELLEEYCEAALGRFVRDPKQTARPLADPRDDSNYYRVPRPGILWNGHTGDTLPKDGGKKRQLPAKAKQQTVTGKANGHAAAPVNGRCDVPQEEAEDFFLTAPLPKRTPSRAAKH